MVYRKVKSSMIRVFIVIGMCMYRMCEMFFMWCLGGVYVKLRK